MVNIKKQTLFSILILIGAILLIYDLATKEDDVSIKIGGIVILMIGLYGSTRQWVDDNKKESSKTDAELIAKHKVEDEIEDDDSTKTNHKDDEKI